MPNPLVFLGGTVIAQGVLGRSAAKSAANASRDAAATQAASAEQGIEETRRQFDAIQELMAPYVQAGGKGLEGLQDMLGFNGQEAQRAQIAGLESSPEFQSITQQGEDAILANASATGGLRGGNTQGALAQFRPAILSELINQRYARLGGITQIGQAAAAGQAAAGQATGQQVSGLLQQQGAAMAGGILGAGQAQAQYKAGIGNTIGSIGTTLGTLAMMGKLPFSDVRLKKNIQQVGVTHRGNKTYVWEWKTGGRGFGVIAQEVAHIPGAVSADVDGLLMVDYSKV